MLHSFELNAQFSKFADIQDYYLTQRYDRSVRFAGRPFFWIKTINPLLGGVPNGRGGYFSRAEWVIPCTMHEYSTIRVGIYFTSRNSYKTKVPCIHDIIC
jgi:hypothetical protein